MKKEDSVKRAKTCAQTYKRLFNTPDGEKVLQDLMRGHGYIKSQFNKDPYEQAFLAGQRFVVERIIGLLKMDFSVLDKRLEQALRKDPFWSESQE